MDGSFGGAVVEQARRAVFGRVYRAQCGSANRAASGVGQTDNTVTGEVDVVGEALVTLSGTHSTDDHLCQGGDLTRLFRVM
jgi:hypothetical protein